MDFDLPPYRIMRAVWRIELLGGLAARRTDGGEISRVVNRFRTRKTGALLAYLAYHNRQRHTREVLIEMLWPEARPETGRNNLRLALASLRRQLEPPDIASGSVISADRATIGLNPDGITTDVAEFKGALRAAEGAGSVQRTRLLAIAIGLYKGTLLPGYYEDWIPVAEQHLEDLYGSALRQLIVKLEQEDDLRGALYMARQGATVAPLNADIAQEVRRLRTEVEQRRLADTGEDAIFEDALEPAVEPAAVHATPWATAATPAPAAPAPLTRFFGREEELARLLEMLRRGERLVTLLGVGGAGKTRLAQELMRQLVQDPTASWRGAIWFVPLADVDDPRLVVSAILDVVVSRPTGAKPPHEQLHDALAQRPTLLVLDNFEHLTGGARLVRQLLERIATLTCVVTSRQRLRVTGERSLSVLPLAIPTADMVADPEQLICYPSVQLFVDRAQAVRPDFQVTPGNSADVARLVALVAGLPLALEIAAGRTAALAPAQIVAQMGQRLDFLTSPRHDTPVRHRSLRDCIDWSYHLLAPELRRFFAHLAVFHGGWTLAAAETVLQEPRAMDYLEQLCEASLIALDDKPGPATPVDSKAGEATLPGALQAPDALQSLVPRYHMLDSLRDYALEQLLASGDDVDPRVWQLRHAEYYAALAERAEKLIGDAEQSRWPGWPDEELENFRVALRWAEAHDEIALGLRLAGVLWWFWSWRGHLAEGREHLAALLAKARPGQGERASPGAASSRAGSSPDAMACSPPALSMETWAKAQSSAGLLAFYDSDYEVARQMLQAALSLWREAHNDAGIASALNLMGAVAHAQGDYELARVNYAASLEVQRKRADKYGIAVALNSLAGVAQGSGDDETAQSLCVEALPLWKQLKDRGGLAWSLNIQGLVSEHSGDLAGARRLQWRSLELRRALDHKHGMASSLYGLGRVALTQGQHTAARACFAESLSLWHALGHRRDVLSCLEALAGVWSAQGQPERAILIMAACQAQRETLEAVRPPYERAGYELSLAIARTALTSASFAVTWNMGQTFTLQETMVEALRDQTSPAPA